MLARQIPAHRRPVFDSKTKGIEWMLTAFMFGWATTLALPGSTFAISTYRDFVKLGIDETDLAIFFMVVSIIRGWALYRNGSLSTGPNIRFFCSAVGAFTWLLTSMLFTLPFIAGGPLPVAASHHFVMFFAELYAIGVAAFDRHSIRR